MKSVCQASVLCGIPFLFVINKHSVENYFETLFLINFSTYSFSHISLGSHFPTLSNGFEAGGKGAGHNP